ncbi:hypothetical protein [Thioalkalivibrio thiocyanodenitrificans]|uniref:hypothetical protein n=1 Tax=Thioalkalivibrio thiocyanodenitrificans TaxID=243063 RepID=UPI00039C46C6|nr:hypothetical protein [Thioalkalivibrio thiocyanodenitrificans]
MSPVLSMRSVPAFAMAALMAFVPATGIFMTMVMAGCPVRRMLAVHRFGGRVASMMHCLRHRLPAEQAKRKA